MGELRVMGAEGDVRSTWDVENKDSIQVARDQFNDLTKKGWTAYSVNKDGSKNKKITSFDPKAGAIIMVPKVVGG